MGLQRPGPARIPAAGLAGEAPAWITAGAGLSGGRITSHNQRWVFTQWISTRSGLGWRTPGRGVAA